MNARDPVAISSTSYVSRTPFSAWTTCANRSISFTRAPACSVMPFSAYHSSGLRKISS